MGDPRSLRKKYSGPGHPWQSERLQEENILVREYGLSTKRELWKVASKLKLFADQAKTLIALRTVQAEAERRQLLDRLARLGMLPADSKLDDVLGLSIRSLLDRRLQTIVMKKGFAKSMKQARQFIIHAHVVVGSKKVSAPGYLVSVLEEPSVGFVENSSLANADHPERVSKPSAKKEASA